MGKVVGVLILLAIAVGGSVFYQHRMMAEHVTEAHQWSREISAHLNKLNQYQFESRAKASRDLSTGLTSLEQRNRASFARLEAMVSSMVEERKIAQQSEDEKENDRAEAEAKLEKEKNEENGDAFEPNPDDSAAEEADRKKDKEELDQIKGADPKDVAANPDEWIRKAKEVEQRFLELQMRAKNLGEEIKLLKSEIAELNRIPEPKPEWVAKAIQQKKEELKKKEEEKRKTEREMERERKKLKLLQLLLRLAAIVAFATGNPEAGLALLMMSGEIGRHADGGGPETTQGTSESGPGGGYPPTPPPGMGGDQATGSGTSKSKGDAARGDSNKPNMSGAAGPSADAKSSPEKAVQEGVGGEIWMRYYTVAPYKAQLSASKIGPWRDWFNLPEDLVGKLKGGKLVRINEAAKALTFFRGDQNWRFENGQLKRAQ